MIDYDFLWSKVRSHLDTEIREEVWSSSGLEVHKSFGLYDRQLLLDVLRETNDFHFLAKLSFISNL
jgi:hypothetical protein